jgi:hypothetical protein
LRCGFLAGVSHQRRGSVLVQAALNTAESSNVRFAMKKFLTLSAMLLLAMLFVVALASSSDSPSIACDVSIAPTLMNSSAIAEQAQIAPGIYTSKPYSMVVIVPHSVDEKMPVITNTPESKMPVIKPEIQLEKR